MPTPMFRNYKKELFWDKLIDLLKMIKLYNFFFKKFHNYFIKILNKLHYPPLKDA